jgi:hypothetical protein
MSNWIWLERPGIELRHPELVDPRQPLAHFERGVRRAEAAGDLLTCNESDWQSLLTLALLYGWDPHGVLSLDLEARHVDVDDAAARELAAAWDRARSKGRACGAPVEFDWWTMIRDLPQGIPDQAVTVLGALRQQFGGPEQSIVDQCLGFARGGGFRVT